MEQTMFVEAIIEMPTGVTYKYECDLGTQSLFLDRVLNQRVPFNYGFIPDTVSADGDPSDIFVVSNMAIYPLARVPARLMGRFRCMDNGIPDDKYVGVLIGEDWKPLEDVADIRKYLETYKPGFQVLSWEAYPEVRQ
jgi:inorganic pyrophosphatase